MELTLVNGRSDTCNCSPKPLMTYTWSDTLSHFLITSSISESGGFSSLDPTVRTWGETSTGQPTRQCGMHKEGTSVVRSHEAFWDAVTVSQASLISLYTWYERKMFSFIQFNYEMAFCTFQISKKLKKGLKLLKSNAKNTRNFKVFFSFLFFFWLHNTQGLNLS